MLPSVSFIIATRNRRETLVCTLGRIDACGLPAGAFETFVVDNASSDGTARAVADGHPDVRLIRLAQNRGSCGKNAALPRARGRYLVFLDDDSYPLPGSIQRMIGHFQRDPTLGAASFDVRLPDSRRECSAYPDVFIGCGVGLRRAAVDQVGGLPDDFLMQAEEYDLSLRLLDAGWRVRSFDDLHVRHEKSPAARSSSQKMRLDVRNNLLLAVRRFPAAWAEAYVREWTARYWAIAAATGRRRPAAQGFAQGAAAAFGERECLPVKDQTFEVFARINATRRRMEQAKRDIGLRRVLLIDWGKNMLAYRLACEAAGVEVVAVADPLLAGRRYRGIPVLSDESAAKLPFDAAVVANLSPAHAERRLAEWRARTIRPVIDLFESDRTRHVARAAA